MKKKIMIFITIIMLFLLGSFVGMVSSTSYYDETGKSCVDCCNKCNSHLDNSDKCNIQGNHMCDGIGECSQNIKQESNWKPKSDCSNICEK